MKFQALRYGEFFQGNISRYNYQRPLIVRFIKCLQREVQEWLVEFYPGSGLNSGMVLAIEHGDQRVLCEIVGRKGAGRSVRLLDSGIDLEALWQQSELALAEA
ncbi:hypothetical protein NY406_02690 [Chlorobaculum sp. MV4-Y]|jgi:hypothetical protein|uniref:hypothetical protein n=1 Tax=Chlorobaculum sp. MV4-Y TaxID=2976335 RepID=UPI0021B019C7|nr:hypothetical protein [Chlorobaculum sp. MV4-Y]UWX58201.1 hypothetical protein NY406_02690 [Chlorobaculum sp. MV4-Y]